MTDLYKQDGVDISAGDAFSRFCSEINRRTYGISEFVEITDFSRGNFRGPRGFELIILERKQRDIDGSNRTVFSSSSSDIMAAPQSILTKIYSFSAPRSAPTAGFLLD